MQVQQMIINILEARYEVQNAMRALTQHEGLHISSTSASDDSSTSASADEYFSEEAPD